MNATVALNLQQKYAKIMNESEKKLQDACFTPLCNYVLDLIERAATEGKLTLQLMLIPLFTDKDRLVSELKDKGFKIQEPCVNQLLITW